MVDNVQLLGLLLVDIVDPKEENNHVNILMTFIYVVKCIKEGNTLDEIVSKLKGMDGDNEFEKIENIIRPMFYAYESWNEIAEEIFID